MMDTLADIAKRFGTEHEPAVSLIEMLDAIFIALTHHPEAILAEGRGFSPRRLVMELRDDIQITSSVKPKADEGLVQLLDDAFKDIAAEYEASELNRKPRATELLATLTFVLGYRPVSYQHVTDPRPIAAIRPE
jgi:hypothetical protein